MRIVSEVEMILGLNVSVMVCVCVCVRCRWIESKRIVADVILQVLNSEGIQTGRFWLGPDGRGEVGKRGNFRKC